MIFIINVILHFNLIIQFKNIFIKKFIIIINKLYFKYSNYFFFYIFKIKIKTNKLYKIFIMTIKK